MSARSLATAALLLAGCSHEARPSIVLVVADTLRADHLSVYGYERETSPELEKWSSRAVVFESAHATSPWTLPSMASLLTGEIPSRHLAGAIVSIDGRDEYLGLSPTTPTLAQELQREGYATAAFVTNPYLRPAFGLDRGFDHYDHAPAENDSIRRAGAVVELALDWMAKQEGPVFALVHLFDPHMDYDPAAQDRGRFREDDAPVTGVHELRDGAADVSPEERARIAAAYDEELLAVDRAVGRLLEVLDGDGFLGEGALFFTADHGEELFDRGGFEHGHSMHREVLGVPLLVWGPELEPARVAGAVSIADLAPTIRDWVGVKGDTFGTSFLSALRGRGLAPRDVVAEMNLYGLQQKMLLRGTDKIICDPTGSYGRLFDVAADPGERTNLSGSGRERFHELAYDLVKLVRTEAQEREGASKVRIDLSTVEELRALGYLDSVE